MKLKQSLLLYLFSCNSELVNVSFISVEQGVSENGDRLAQGDKLFKDDELVQLIDPILSMDDSNNDGYIDYPEFIRAQQNAAASART